MSIMPLCPLTATLAPEHDPGPSPSLLPARGDKAVVIGSGRSGRAAARLLARMGARVHLLEASADHLDGSVAAELAELNVTVELGAHRPEQFQDARFVIPSPGVPLRTIFSLMNLPVTAPLERAGGPCILAETELAFRCLQGEKVLAVTGTSGKTTTVHLMTAMLEAAGKKVCLAGNVGTPLSEYILSGGGKLAEADINAAFLPHSIKRALPGHGDARGVGFHHGVPQAQVFRKCPEKCLTHMEEGLLGPIGTALALPMEIAEIPAEQVAEPAHIVLLRLDRHSHFLLIC